MKAPKITIDGVYWDEKLDAFFKGVLNCLFMATNFRLYIPINAGS